MVGADRSLVGAGIGRPERGQSIAAHRIDAVDRDAGQAADDRPRISRVVRAQDVSATVDLRPPEQLALAERDDPAPDAQVGQPGGKGQFDERVAAVERPVQLPRRVVQVAGPDAGGDERPQWRVAGVQQRHLAAEVAARRCPRRPRAVHPPCGADEGAVVVGDPDDVGLRCDREVGNRSGAWRELVVQGDELVGCQRQRERLEHDAPVRLGDAADDDDVLHAEAEAEDLGIEPDGQVRRVELVETAFVRGGEETAVDRHDPSVGRVGEDRPSERRHADTGVHPGGSAVRRTHQPGVGG